MDDLVPDLPTRPDDPRLDGWYHTIDFGRGLVSRGAYDHRPVIDRYGLPLSLRGKTALDVGTMDGFFAFEMERRGADRVVAIDIARLGDVDYLPRVRARRGPDALDGPTLGQFTMAHALLRSRVEHRTASVYDLSPDTVGTFDVVFCGSLLVHLWNPILALCNIRSVTRGLAIIETTVDAELEESFPGRPYLSFGALDHEDRARQEPGAAVVYWRFTTRALCDMLVYAGFAESEPQGRFDLPPIGNPSTSIVAYAEDSRSENERRSARAAAYDRLRGCDQQPSRAQRPLRAALAARLPWLAAPYRRARSWVRFHVLRRFEGP